MGSLIVPVSGTPAFLLDWLTLQVSLGSSRVYAYVDDEVDPGLRRVVEALAAQHGSPLVLVPWRAYFHARQLFYWSQQLAYVDGH